MAFTPVYGGCIHNYNTGGDIEGYVDCYCLFTHLIPAHTTVLPSRAFVDQPTAIIQFMVYYITNIILLLLLLLYPLQDHYHYHYHGHGHGHGHGHRHHHLSLSLILYIYITTFI